MPVTRILNELAVKSYNTSPHVHAKLEGGQVIEVISVKNLSTQSW